MDYATVIYFSDLLLYKKIKPTYILMRLSNSVTLKFTSRSIIQLRNSENFVISQVQPSAIRTNSWSSVNHPLNFFDVHFRLWESSSDTTAPSVISSSIAGTETSNTFVFPIYTTFVMVSVSYTSVHRSIKRFHHSNGQTVDYLFYIVTVSVNIFLIHLIFFQFSYIILYR